MSSDDQRYRRAFLRSAPKFAATTPNLFNHGYWIDEFRYFFIREEFDTAQGILVAVPCLADVRDRDVQAVVPLELATPPICQTAQSFNREHSAANRDFAAEHLLALCIDDSGSLCERDRASASSKSGLEEEAIYSPCGRYAAVLRDHDLAIRDLTSGGTRRITSDGRPDCHYARQPEVSLSAVSYRRAPHPVGIWSQDSEWFLTHCIDESGVPRATIVDQCPRLEDRPLAHSFHYSLPGDRLPTGVIVAVHAFSGRVVRFDKEPFEVSTFSPFFHRRLWFSAPRQAVLLRLDRHARRAELISLDLAEGTTRQVHSEAVSDGFLCFNSAFMGTPNVRVLSGSAEFIWYSQSQGWGHLYLHDWHTGARKNDITQGAWTVRSLLDVDEAGRKVFFTASGILPQMDPVDRVLCVADLNGGGCRVIAKNGDIFAESREPAGLAQDKRYARSYVGGGLSPDFAHVVCRASNPSSSRLAICSCRDGQEIVPLTFVAVEETRAPEEVAVLAADGTTPLHALLFLPPDFDECKRYPLIDYIYPGPQIPQRPRSPSMVAAQARSLAELGFAVMTLDSRAMPFRSRAFHQAGYGSLLEPQLSDHVAAIKQLCRNRPFLDESRVGIIGNSAGGAAAARALFDYPHCYSVGVAVSGNHDASRYASVWSDTYRGPISCADVEAQANRSVARKLTGKLLLMAGGNDENVHVGHTLALAQALTDAGRQFDLLIVPNGGHDMFWTSSYVQHRAWRFLSEHLLGKSEPCFVENAYGERELTHVRHAMAVEARQW